jgi:hypothetical protein
MQHDIMHAYEFLDTFAKNVSQDMPIQRYEMLYRLELTNQKYIMLAMLGIGFLGICLILALSL